MAIRNGPEVQSALLRLSAQMPPELLDEFVTLANAPAPLAAYRISQFLYLHRSEVPLSAIEVGRDMLQFVTFDYQWSGFVETGMAQIPYMEKALGNPEYSDLDEADAPHVHPPSGVSVPDAPEDSPAEPAPEEPPA
ncbi:hypothetical protein [Parasphingorhabdus sp.]|uniref:hypothetical protein n=1 Tax=Parasphingorhabdus sp. TaxID=2709688 RepID=UPI003A951523